MDLSLLSHYQACSFDNAIIAISLVFIDMCAVHAHC